jgi:hypothetical protein
MGRIEDNAIRPFHINIPEEELVDLRRRIAATRWPESGLRKNVERRASAPGQPTLPRWRASRDPGRPKASHGALGIAGDTGRVAS